MCDGHAIVLLHLLQLVVLLHLLLHLHVQVLLELLMVLVLEHRLAALFACAPIVHSLMMVVVYPVLCFRSTVR